MFTNLFYGLKEASVPISLREYLTLLEAMEKGVAMWDVEEFYFLARSALIKDERNIDKFDRVFSQVFKGLEAVSGLSFLVDKACIALKPPIPASVTAASEPPVTITSALPRRI